MRLNRFLLAGLSVAILCPAPRVSAADITAQLDSTDGGSALVIQDASERALLSVDSLGNIQAAGPFTSAAGFIGNGAGLTNLPETDPVWRAVSNTISTQAAQGAEAYAWLTDEDVTGAYVQRPELEAVSNRVSLIETWPTNLWSSAFVQKAGDTMTGALVINAGVDNELAISSAGNAIRIGAGAVVGEDALAIGTDAAAATQSLAVGSRANGLWNGTAIGIWANGYNFGTAVGWGAKAESGTAIGFGANGSYGIAIGQNARGDGSGGIAIGTTANGRTRGVAIGPQANGYEYGIAIGYQAVGNNYGMAVGQNANGFYEGMAIGARANGSGTGTALGIAANGQNYGTAIGGQANAASYGIALGSQANGMNYNIAIGFESRSSGGGLTGNRTAIGTGVTNHYNNSVVLRGNLYLDGGGSNIYYRTTFGAGGAASWSTKTFVIDHPLDPENKVLRHYTLEGPEVLNVYSGITTLDANGEAAVALPDYFEALNRDPRYLLTAIGGPMPDLHVQSEVAANHFRIGGGAPGGRVSWDVKALRNDPACLEDLERRPVEQLKSELAPGQAAREAAAANTMAVTLR